MNTARATKKVEAVEPPDLDQCQVYIPNGNNSGKYGGITRCTKKPAFLAEEQITGNKEQKSMCPECFLQFMGQGDSGSKYRVSVIEGLKICK